MNMHNPVTSTDGSEQSPQQVHGGLTREMGMMALSLVGEMICPIAFALSANFRNFSQLFVAFHDYLFSLFTFDTYSCFTVRDKSESTFFLLFHLFTCKS